MTEAVRSMFADIAVRYDLANRLLSAGRDVAWRRRSIKQLSHTPRQVLDLACGTGDLSVDMRRQFPDCKVIAADFCLPMIQAGHEKFQDSHIRPATADALHLPFPDQSFDAAFIAYGWRNVDNKEDSLKELHRVLKPGGQLVILEFFRPRSWWPRLFHATFSRFLIPALGGMITGQRSAYSYLHQSIIGFLSTEESDTMLAQVGFDERRWISHFGGVSHAAIATRSSSP